MNIQVLTDGEPNPANMNYSATHAKNTPVDMKARWNTWTKVGLAVLTGGVMLNVLWRGVQRWRGGNATLQQTVPMDVMARARLADKHGRYKFRYALLTVFNEKGRKVYDGNVLTLFRRPNNYVGVTPDGFELWDINTIFSAQNQKAHPLLFTRSFENARDDIYVPFYLTSPLKRMLGNITMYDWQNKKLDVRINRKGVFEVSMPNGKTERTRTLRYLDGRNRRRVVQLNELE